MKETTYLYVIFLVVAIFVSNCGVFPQDERYIIDESINDNATEQQQIEYWGKYGF